MILPKEVWTVRQVLVVTFASVGTLVVTLENTFATTRRTLWNSQAMQYFRETSISFFWVCGYNKLNKFNEGDLVFPDVYIRRVSDNFCSPPNKHPYEPRHLSVFVCDSRVGSATLPGAPKVLSGAPTCFQTYHNHSHRTPVSVIRDPSYSCTGRQGSQLLWRPAGIPS